MKERELKLIDVNTLQIGMAVVIDSYDNAMGKYSRNYSTEYLTPFHGINKQEGYNLKEIGSTASLQSYDIQWDNKIREEITICNTKISVDVLNELSVSYNKDMEQIKVDFPAVWEMLMNRLEPTFIYKYNQQAIKEREAKKKAIQDKFDMLKEICFDYKTDLKTLEECDQLYYCEADTVMQKMIDRINKKGSAKALIIARRMAEYKKEDYIDCGM